MMRTSLHKTLPLALVAILFLAASPAAVAVEIEASGTGSPVLPPPWKPRSGTKRFEHSTRIRPTHGTLDRLHGPLLRSDIRGLAAPSCAAASCHGGPRPGVAQPAVERGSEYALWIEHDPHARSWETFCSTKSVDMMKRLRILDESGNVLNPAGYDNCLACHNSNPRFTSSDFRREGVGCAACHGPAERWIGSHFKNGWHPESAAAEGFVNHRDLLTRARTCAACHVGDQDRDMNHDIIAAGHPVLHYDFATYHQRQPKHWRDEGSALADQYEAQLWLAGQIASADASLSLLVTRGKAARKGGGLPSVSHWPELSSYDCASCHHDLGLSNQRRPLRDASSSRSTRPAVADASAWNVWGLREILRLREARGQSTIHDRRLMTCLDAVRSALESSRSPSGIVVSGRAEEARAALADWVDRVYRPIEGSFDARKLAGVVVEAAGEGETFSTWETTTQFYLAAVASRYAWPGGPQGIAGPVAGRLGLGLRYPDRRDVPRFSTSEPGPRLTRTQAARLAVQFAEYLGDPASPNLETFQQDEIEREQLMEEMRSMLRRVDQIIDDARRARQPDEDATRPDEKPGADPEKPTRPKGSEDRPQEPTEAPDKPDNEKSDNEKPRVKSREELLEELRERQRKASNPFGDDQ